MAGGQAGGEPAVWPSPGDSTAGNPWKANEETNKRALALHPTTSLLQGLRNPAYHPCGAVVSILGFQKAFTLEDPKDLGSNPDVDIIFADLEASRACCPGVRCHGVLVMHHGIYKCSWVFESHRDCSLIHASKMRSGQLIKSAKSKRRFFHRYGSPSLPPKLL